MNDHVTGPPLRCRRFSKYHKPAPPAPPPEPAPTIFTVVKFKEPLHAPLLGIETTKHLLNDGQTDEYTGQDVSDSEYIYFPIYGYL